MALAGAFWGLQSFIRLAVLCPQILGIEQKTKNFQLFSRVTSEGKNFSIQLFLAEFKLAGMYGMALCYILSACNEKHAVTYCQPVMKNMPNSSIILYIVSNLSLGNRMMQFKDTYLK